LEKPEFKHPRRTSHMLVYGGRWEQQIKRTCIWWIYGGLQAEGAVQCSAVTIGTAAGRPAIYRRLMHPRRSVLGGPIDCCTCATATSGRAPMQASP
jgi:hypothetical protein